MANSPKTSDGKSIVLNNLFPGSVLLYYTGSADHATNGRGEGAQFNIVSDQIETKELEFGFNDWVYLAGGSCKWKDGVVGDSVCFKLIAPATPITAAPQNDGNCNLVSGILVPAAGNGAYNVDLTQAVLVPALAAATGDYEGNPNGYWDWDEPQTGRGTITPSTTPGSAKWHLVPAAIDLARFICKLQLMGTESVDLMLPAIKPKKILPHWKLKVVLHNTTAKTLSLTWLLVSARVKNV
jgi:hypothetical protein